VCSCKYKEAFAWAATVKHNFPFYKAMANLDDSAKNAYIEMKTKHAYKYVIFKLADSKTVVLEKAAPASATYEQFLADLPNDCRWAVVDFDYKTKTDQTHSKLVFVIWSPDDAPRKSKMSYATWNNVVNQKLEQGGIPIIVQATGPDEITREVVLDKVTRRQV